jgi:hypothetical protein
MTMVRSTVVAALMSLALAAGVPPTCALAQVPDRPYGLAGGRVVLSGDVSAVVGRPDTTAFFNYTDYEHNALRLARLRLLGEWRVRARLSVLGEVRTENVDGVQVAALYVRWQPFAGRDFDLQAGRIPPVIGAFARRAYGRDNLVIGEPLAYQYLTSLRPDALPARTSDLLRMRGRGWEPSFPIGSTAAAPGIPLVASSRWDTGVEAHSRVGWLELAGAITRGSPAVPVVRDTNDGREWSGRAAVDLPSGVTVGVSGARGQWVDAGALALVPADRRSASRQTVAGADLEVGRGHWLLRAEWLRASFQMPFADPAASAQTLRAWSAFAEARYRLSPRWEMSARVDGLRFSDLAASAGAPPESWDAPVDRVEGVVGFRVRRNLELRGGWQQDWRDGGFVHRRGYPAFEALYWF